MSGGKVVHVLSGKSFDVYVGRPMPRLRLRGSGWGNPYRIGEDGTRDEVLRRYEVGVRYWLTVEGGEGDAWREEVASLRGKTLACWCAPRDGTPLTLDDETVCHGQILLRLAEQEAS